MLCQRSIVHTYQLLCGGWKLASNGGNLGQDVDAHNDGRVVLVFVLDASPRNTGVE